MDKHTAGPWKVITSDEDITQRTIVDDNNFWIARVLNFDHSVDDLPESRANAQLIAAAPTLLKHLREATRCLKSLNMANMLTHNDEWKRATAVVTEAQALITKITGVQ